MAQQQSSVPPEGALSQQEQMIEQKTTAMEKTDTEEK